MNIKELAKALALSTSTVSRALNGYTDVNAQTRQRVQDMAQKLGYRADAGARRLVSGKSDAVGIVYSAAAEDLGNPQFLEMAGGLAERLELDRLDLLLAVAKNDTEIQIYDRLFRGGRVDAVIVANTRVQDTRIAHLQSLGYPFVAYGQTADCTSYSWFDFDNALGSQMAVRHLVDLGHKRIAYAHSPLSLNYAFQRRQGFLSAMKSAGLTCAASMQVGDAHDHRSGILAAQTLLAQKPMPTAILVDNNLGGMGVLQGLVNAGVQAGTQVSVVVHGDIPADVLHSGLQVTSVIQPTAHDTGATLAEMVLKVLREPALGPYQILRKPALILGTTSGPVR